MLRHEQQTVRMVLAAVEHHSHGAPREQTTATRTKHFAQVVFPQERNSERIMEQAIDPPVPQDEKGLRSSVWRPHLPSPEGDAWPSAWRACRCLCSA